MAALLVVGTLLWTGFGLGLWAQRQVLDKDQWADTSEQLLESEPIRTALAYYLVDRLYDSEAVEQRLTNVLPPRLDPLAAPASAALKDVARRNAPRLLGTAVALQAWREANVSAHDALFAIVKGSRDGSVTLDLGSLLRGIAEGTGLPASAVDRLPPAAQQLEVLRSDELEQAQTALDVLEAAAWVLLVLSLAAFGGALALSGDRRRTAASIGGCMIIAAIAILALRRLVGAGVVDSLADTPNGRTAAEDAWEIATSLLVDVAQGSMLLGAFVISGAWLAGPGRWATKGRDLAAPTLRDRPGIPYATLALALLLLVLWGPVPWTGKVFPMLLFTAMAFAWLTWIRQRAIADQALP